MYNNRKKYVQIKNHTSSDQIFALLDKVRNVEEEDIEKLINDSDTEFLAKGNYTENIVPHFDNGDILTPGASTHIVEDNEKEKGKNSKSKLEEV